MYISGDGNLCSLNRSIFKKKNLHWNSLPQIAYYFLCEFEGSAIWKFSFFRDLLWLKKKPKNLTLLVVELTSKLKWLFYLCCYGIFGSETLQSSVTNVDTTMVINFGLTSVNVSSTVIPVLLIEVFGVHYLKVLKHPW